MTLEDDIKEALLLDGESEELLNKRVRCNMCHRETSYLYATKVRLSEEGYSEEEERYGGIAYFCPKCETGRTLIFRWLREDNE